jgi:hypothetical protein
VPYGEGERALESQRRTPLPNNRAQLSLVQGGGGAPDEGGDALAAAMEMMAPESAIAAPTERPQEPIVAGLGPGGQGARPTIAPNEAYYELQALVRQYPYPDLIRLLGRVEAEM